MSAAVADEASAPLKIEFDSNVELTIHGAFLPTARLLQCDPAAQLSVSTLRKTMPARGATAGGRSMTTSTVATEHHVAFTRRQYFTSKPNFNETLRFLVPGARVHCPTGKGSLARVQKQMGLTTDTLEDEQGVEQRVIITLEDAQGEAYGQAVCPFMLHAPSRSTQPVRLMLQPRNAHDKFDPLFKKDVAKLVKCGMDDFGFVTVSWDVSLSPHGGALITASPTSVNQPMFPVGLVLRATWLVPGHTYQRGTQYTTSVEFGGQDRFVFDGANPLFLTIQNATQLERAIIHCTIQNAMNHTNAYDVAVTLPIQPMASFAMERDVWWTTAVRTARGTDLGLLFACIRLVRQPLGGETPMCAEEYCGLINDPAHQAQYAHVARDWGRPPPDVPPGAYQPIFWESDQHITRATERRWKRDCIMEANPSMVHVRHLLDVIMGRAALDPGVARVLSVFFNQAEPGFSPNELRQFLVTCTFHVRTMTPLEAARFCFFALRCDMEQAIARDDVIFILEHALIGRTIEMPEMEVRRRVVDIFGDTTYVIFEDFVRYFIHNYAMWYAFGVPITVSEERSGRGSDVAQSPTLQPTQMSALFKAEGPNAKTHAAPATSTVSYNNSKAAAAAVVGQAAATTATAKAAMPHDEGVWRTFIARVQHSNKAFSVTAHVNDTISDVMLMVQNSTGIRAACQEWRTGGVALDPKCRLETTELGLGKSEVAAPEVIIIARDEVVRLVMVYKDKGFRWDVRLPATERVLKLRALVQQKTMIPLTRCVLQAHGSFLLDRHPLMHYNLQDGDVVTITQE
ncbi:hypothetical protein TraAM80_05165 [Trypanosoma rangeli]|uniref:Ubiquitin-like domain-containing protein n=1 Tax=Trypanosoma rangeli TaxID=5698 RepID=A0A422NG65_TRYRA|nr:uncharacterized protein TraAM80_05165 [Trypanosoma rangeli]RNF04450.1 hypothetical protein TraAM80_05165 [Trypanosoma rangeli]|eukprot:RNF04450.1 hypothetical protein TraAM80_05165 [Trypanosoma rangeli]